LHQLTNLTCRALPTAVDRETFEKMKDTIPAAETHPNVFAWFCLVRRFTDAVRGTWAGAAAAGKQEKKATKEEKPKAAADDEMDLFGDDEEVDVVSLLLNRSERYIKPLL